MTAVANTERPLGGADSSYFLSFCLPRGGTAQGRVRHRRPASSDRCHSRRSLWTGLAELVRPAPQLGVLPASPASPLHALHS